MTEVDPTQRERATDLPRLFRSGYNPVDAQALGSEAEFFLIRNGQIAAPETCLALADRLKERGYSASIEFSGIIEHAGAPHRADARGRFDLSGIVSSVQRAYGDFRAQAQDLGYELADTSHLATLTEDAAARQLAHRPRASAGFQSMQRHAPLGCRLLPLLNASVQVSLSVRSDEELFETLYDANRLTPFIYATFANHPSVFNGQSCREFHPRGELYEAYGAQGGLAPSFLKAQTPRELVQFHLDELKSTPLFFTFDEKTASPVVPEDRLPCFAGLPAEAQTVAHFRLAQSFNYHDNKICNVYDGNSVVAKRVEVRAFDTGADNMAAAPVFCALALRHPEVRQEVRALLDDYGISRTSLRMDRQAAVHHGGKYMDVAFGRLGNGRAGRMLNFSSEVGHILERAVQSEDTVVRQALQPLLDVCHSGVSRAHRLARD